MRNNFTFNASIKVKELNKMNTILNFMKSENLNNKDTAILNAFGYILNQFEGDIHTIKMYDVLDAFATFYEEILVPYCKEELIMCTRFEEFEWECVQFVMDKMAEIITIIQSKYGVVFK